VAHNLSELALKTIRSYFTSFIYEHSLASNYAGDKPKGMSGLGTWCFILRTKFQNLPKPYSGRDSTNQNEIHTDIIITLQKNI